MLKIGHNKYCDVVHSGTHYTFHHLRDFHRTSEDYKQEERWITDTFDVEKITGVDLIVAPFGPKNLLAHTMLTFSFSDTKKITLSVEAQLDEGSEYNFWKATFLGYYNLYIWGSEEDHVGLRKLRGESVWRYPLHLEKENVKKLFVDLAMHTNTVHREHERYAFLRNNCTSSLWNTARKYFPLPRWHWTLFLVPRLPKFLQKKGALKLTEREKIAG